MKKIIVGGCSHVFGHGLPDCIEGITPSKLAWPAYIGREFECEIINFSRCGWSATQVIRSIQDYQEVDLVSAMIIIMPFSRRRLLIHRGIEFNYTNTVPEHNPIFRRALENYEKYCHHEITDTVNYISYAGYLNNISNKFNIPLWLICSDSMDQKTLKDHNINLGMPDDWINFCYKNRYTTTKDGHYGPDAHREIYKLHIKPWLLENVFK